MTAVLALAGRAQNHGAWGAAFDHQSPAQSPLVYQGPKPAGAPNAVWPTQFNAVHMSLIPRGPYRGAVLVWDYQGGEVLGYTRFSIVDPTQSGALVSGGLHYNFINGWLDINSTAPTAAKVILFCAGHAWNSNGDLFSAGGTGAPWPMTLQTWNQERAGATTPTPFKGAKIAYTWDPATGILGTWIKELDMQVERWYPSVVMTATRKMVVLGGIHDQSFAWCNTFEQFEYLFSGNVWNTNNQNPQANLNDPNGTPWAQRVYYGPMINNSGTINPVHFYPRCHVLSDGRIFGSGFNKQGIAILPSDLPATPYAWNYTQGLPNSSTAGIVWRIYGSHFMRENYNQVFDRVFRMGGSDLINSTVVLLSSIEYCDVKASQPSTWVKLTDMAKARDYMNAVMLPDGKVFIVGGRTNGAIDTYAVAGGPGDLNSIQHPLNSSQVAELFDPANTVTDPLPLVLSNTVGTQTGPRVYHSTALLLPDGRVLVAGGEARLKDYQLFSPPYLSNGFLRPVIDSAPSTLGYSPTQANFQITHHWPGLESSEFMISKVVLVRPGSVTHHSDVDARVIQLPIITQSDLSLEVAPPANANKVPPGYYMMFLVDTNGTPSVASWVQVG